MSEEEDKTPFAIWGIFPGIPLKNVGPFVESLPSDDDSKHRRYPDVIEPGTTYGDRVVTKDLGFEGRHRVVEWRCRICGAGQGKARFGNLLKAERDRIKGCVTCRTDRRGGGRRRQPSAA